MGLRPLEIFFSFIAVTDFKRQNLTYKGGPGVESVNIVIAKNE